MKKEHTSSVGSKTVKSTMLLLLGVFYSRIINLIMTILLARILVPEDFGLVALGTTLLLIVNSITDISLASALIHHKEVTEEDFDTAFTLSLMRGLIVSVVVILGGAYMAEIYSDSRLVAICFGLSLRPLVASLSSPRYVLYSKELRFGTVALQESINYTAQFLISVSIAIYTQSYWAIVSGAVFSSVIGTTFTYFVAPYRPTFSLASWRRLLGFSFWLTLNEFLTIVGNRFDNFLAGSWLGLSVFGAMNVGNNIAGVVTQSAVAPMQRVLFPSFAQIAHNRDRLKVAFQKSQASLFTLGLAVGVGTALVAEPFVYLTLGPNWPVAVLVIQCIAPVLGAQVVFGPVNAICNAVGATKVLFYRGLILVLFRVPIVLAGLYFYGLPGILLARIVSGGVVTSAANFYLVRRLINLTVFEQIFVTWRSWIAGLCMTIFCLLLGRYLGPINNNTDAIVLISIQASAGSMVYCLVHFGLWWGAGRTDIGLETEVVKMLSKLKSKR